MPRELEDAPEGVLAHYGDRYDGVIVDHESLPANLDAFTPMLDASLAHWRSKGVRGVWLKVPTANADFVGPAVGAGFAFHHAEPTYVMLTQWLPEHEKNLLPANASHQVGIGAFVRNDKGEVLMVQERRGPATRFENFWKVPTVRRCKLDPRLKAPGFKGST